MFWLMKLLLDSSDVVFREVEYHWAMESVAICVCNFEMKDGTYRAIWVLNRTDFWLNDWKQVTQTVKAFKNFHLLFIYSQQTGLRRKDRGLRGKNWIPENAYHSRRHSFGMQQLRITILSLYLRKTCIIAQFESRVIMG